MFAYISCGYVTFKIDDMFIILFFWEHLPLVSVSHSNTCHCDIEKNPISTIYITEINMPYLSFESIMACDTFVCVFLRWYLILLQQATILIRILCSRASREISMQISAWQSVDFSDRGKARNNWFSIMWHAMKY